MRYLFVLVLALSASACAPVDPIGGGHIRTRCDGRDGSTTTSTSCAPGQFVLCLVGHDAGNGDSLAVCCDATEAAETCAQRAGFSARDN